MPRVALIVLAVLILAAPDAASADFVHVVAPGETLTSIAAADGLSVAELAAANGISPYTQVIAGTGIQIPPQSLSQGLPQGPAQSQAQGGRQGDGDGDSDDPEFVSASAPPVSAAPSISSSYVVQPGDTLTAIAARAGISVAELAAANGIDPNAPLLTGAVLRLSGSVGSAGTVASASSQPVGAAAQGSPTQPPYPTAETVTAGQVGSIASANGVSPSLADAIAYQESGFNNDVVSSADARGVMQILPGTWQWIQHTLDQGGPPLAPASASDNVRGGVLLLRSLLSSTGGDPAMAAAGYFQGLPSVQQNGVYPSTQQYVNDVMSLRQQFGGG